MNVLFDTGACSSVFTSDGPNNSRQPTYTSTPRPVPFTHAHTDLLAFDAGMSADDMTAQLAGLDLDLNFAAEPASALGSGAPQHELPAPADHPEPADIPHPEAGHDVGGYVPGMYAAGYHAAPPADPLAMLHAQATQVVNEAHHCQSILDRVQADEAYLQQQLAQAEGKDKPAVEAQLQQCGQVRRNTALRLAHLHQLHAHLSEQHRATQAAMSGAAPAASAPRTFAQAAGAPEPAQSDDATGQPSDAAEQPAEQPDPVKPGSLADAAPFGCAPFQVPEPEKKLGTKMMPRHVHAIAANPLFTAKRAGVDLVPGQYYEHMLRVRRIAEKCQESGYPMPPEAALLPEAFLPSLAPSEESKGSNAAAVRSRLFELSHGVLGRNDKRTYLAPPKCVDLGDEQLDLSDEAVLRAARLKFLSENPLLTHDKHGKPLKFRVKAAEVSKQLERMAELARLRPSMRAAVDAASKELDQRVAKSVAKHAAMRKTGRPKPVPLESSDSDEEPAGPSSAEIAESVNQRAAALAMLQAQLPKEGGEMETRHAAESVANSVLMLQQAQLALGAEQLRHSDIAVLNAAQAGERAMLWHMAKLLALIPDEASFQGAALPDTWPWQHSDSSAFAILLRSPKGKRQLCRALMKLPAAGAVAAVYNSLARLPNVVISRSDEADAKTADHELTGFVLHMLGAASDVAPEPNQLLRLYTDWILTLCHSHDADAIAALMSCDESKQVISTIVDLGDRMPLETVAPETREAWEAALNQLLAAVSQE